MMKDIDIFLDRINKVANDLDNLSREFTDLYKQYNGSEFENQHYLAADKLDNSILAVTHEMATTLSFASADIKILTNFIDFRKLYKKLNDQELENIIDNPTISLQLKLSISKKIANADAKNSQDQIQGIQHLWNKTFDNKKYMDVRNKLLINV